MCEIIFLVELLQLTLCAKAMADAGLPVSPEEEAAGIEELRERLEQAAREMPSPGGGPAGVHQRVVSRYAVLLALDFFSKEGYSSAEEESLADGTVRLLLRKWAAAGAGAAARREIELFAAPDGTVKTVLKAGQDHIALHREVEAFAAALGHIESQRIAPECSAPALQRVQARGS